MFGEESCRPARGQGSWFTTTAPDAQDYLSASCACGISGTGACRCLFVCFFSVVFLCLVYFGISYDKKMYRKYNIRNSGLGFLGIVLAFPYLSLVFPVKSKKFPDPGLHLVFCRSSTCRCNWCSIGCTYRCSCTV